MLNWHVAMFACVVFGSCHGREPMSGSALRMAAGVDPAKFIPGIGDLRSDASRTAKCMRLHPEKSADDNEARTVMGN